MYTKFCLPICWAVCVQAEVTKPKTSMPFGSILYLLVFVSVPKLARAIARAKKKSSWFWATVQQQKDSSFFFFKVHIEG